MCKIYLGVGLPFVVFEEKKRRKKDNVDDFGEEFSKRTNIW